MEYDQIVVGAGATGLVAALTAAERGERVLVLEREDVPGGRLATDREDGFVFDRGFQILLTAYPAVQRWLDLGSLWCAAFDPGANVLLTGGGSTIVADPLRNFKRVVSTVRSPVGSVLDKALLLQLVAYVRSRPPEALFREEERSTRGFLVAWGFSARMIDSFFRPFYGGIFLERELSTSSRFFLFTFKMFAEGQAALPRYGIRAVAEQLAARLPPNAVRYSATVESATPNSVRLSDGTTLNARRVIDTRPPSAPPVPAGRWLTTVNLYVSTPTTGLPRKLITLVPGGGAVNNVAVLTGVQPRWAPAGVELLSLSLYARAGAPTRTYFELAYRQLFPWLGEELDAWRPLRHYEVAPALPFTPHAEWSAPASRWSPPGGPVHAGDWRLHPSLQAAMLAGELAAHG